jgi:Tol biopolymer transport system component
VSADGQTVASVQRNMTANVLVGPANAPDKAQQITFGRLDGNNGLVFAADDQVVYTGNHTQNWDLFIVGPDGTNARQLSFDRVYHGSAAVCDHDRSVVYNGDSGGKSHLSKIDLRSGGVSQLTNSTGELIPSCGGSGDPIFYWGQTGNGTTFIYKVPAAGGASTRVSDRVAISPPFVSLDGKHVLFATPLKDGSVGGALLTADTGNLDAEMSVPPTFDASVSTMCWMPDNRSIALPDLRSGVANLWSQSVTGTGPQQQLTHFTSGKIWACAFSADGKYVAISHGSRQSDAVLFTKANGATAGQ